VPPTVPPAIAPLLEELLLPGLVNGLVVLVAVELAELVVKLVAKSAELELVAYGTSVPSVMKPMVEASLRVNPVMMLTPVMLQHEGGGVELKSPQQKVPAEVEHCDSSGVFPTLVILRQNRGHDGDDQS